MSFSRMIAVAAFLVLATHGLAQTSNRPDWITATNQPCRIWNPNPQPNESVTWSGECRDGYASGQGILRWTLNGRPDARYEGSYANGKRNGHGVLIMPDGRRIEGEWFNDELLSNEKSI
jgi:MORN repeat